MKKNWENLQKKVYYQLFNCRDFLIMIVELLGSKLERKVTYWQKSLFKVSIDRTISISLKEKKSKTYIEKCKIRIELYFTIHLHLQLCIFSFLILILFYQGQAYGFYDFINFFH